MVNRPNYNFSKSQYLIKFATATQVALYKFNIAQNIWEKAEKEGALFLYSRNGEPFHSLMIFNRLNKDNFIEPIIKDFDYQVQLPFLLYRSKSKIFGIWFFNKEECIRVASLIESLMDNNKVDYRFSGHDRQENGVQGNIDIFSMLSKAQEKFNKTPCKPESNPSTFSSSTPRAPDISSQSVMDFFAKASTKSATQKPAATGENVLHRLMSNPAHTVEHIEKQQRSITPQENLSFKGEVDTACVRRSVPISFPNTVKRFENFENSQNGFNIPRCSPPQSQTTAIAMAASPLAYLMQNQPSTSQPAEESIEVLGTSPFQQFLESTQKPLLMTPMMFTAPNSSKEPLNTTNHPVDDGPVEMLTEKQLAQALIYLLKNNSDFIKQIHQAYTSSILDKVDKTRNRSNS
ncbi:mRNA-decapping enzyme 1A isoform X2 [Euwallacea similis]|uniref:mRNA-decapping enzyme 1A isoform X2 n=1 Tax=Euwallacea similis TaxID=1736056 RepID=UPI00344EB909